MFLVSYDLIFTFHVTCFKTSLVQGNRIISKVCFGNRVFSGMKLCVSGLAFGDVSKERVFHVLGSRSLTTALWRPCNVQSLLSENSLIISCSVQWTEGGERMLSSSAPKKTTFGQSYCEKMSVLSFYFVPLLCHFESFQKETNTRKYIQHLNIHATTNSFSEWPHTHTYMQCFKDAPNISSLLAAPIDILSR